MQPPSKIFSPDAAFLKYSWNKDFNEKWTSSLSLRLLFSDNNAFRVRVIRDSRYSPTPQRFQRHFRLNFFIASSFHF